LACSSLVSSAALAKRGTPARAIAPAPAAKKPRRFISGTFVAMFLFSNSANHSHFQFFYRQLSSCAWRDE
jgi:hypothetical protein